LSKRSWRVCEIGREARGLGLVKYGFLNGTKVTNSLDRDMHPTAVTEQASLDISTAKSISESVLGALRKIVFPVLFSNPDGICSLAVAKLAGISFDNEDGTELLPLVVSGSLPAPSKVKLQFGHQVTKADTKHQGDVSPFYSTPSILQTQLTSEVNNWNPQAVDTLEFRIARLHRLRLSQIGGILIIMSHWDAESESFGVPILRVIAIPALATLGSFSSKNRPSINLQEAWDLDSPPFDQMPVSDYSCLLLVMAGGFSCGISPLTLANYLARTAPLFIPSGEDVAGTVSLASEPAIFQA
jgi:hypothetical protein